MSNGESPKQQEEKPVSHLDSPVGVVLTILTLIGFVILLFNLRLATGQKWAFGVISYFVASLACVAAWGLVDSIVKFLAHLLWTIIFALNLLFVLFILVGSFGDLQSVDDLTKGHLLQAAKQLAILFGADLLAALVFLPFARVTKVEPV